MPPAPLIPRLDCAFNDLGWADTWQPSTVPESVSLNWKKKKKANVVGRREGAIPQQEEPS